MEKGDKVIARGGKKATGVATGGTRRCQLEGCRCIRHAVRWDDNSLTWVSSKSITWNKVSKAWRLI